MKPSNRILTLNGAPGASDGWAVYDRARQLLGAGEDVTMLCIGEHDRKTAPFILDAMDRSARSGNTGYAPLQGQPGLRTAIAARAARTTGAPVDPDQVIVTTGGQAALFAAFCAAVDPGDRAVLVDPYYATYPATVRAAGAVVATVQANPEAGFQLDRDALATACQGARAILINTPHNPTGAVYSDATLAAIAETTAGMWVISDEVYDSQAHDGDHRSIRALPGMAGRTLVVGSMSKSHVMTGFRLGWIIAPPALVGPICDLANATTYGVPGFIQDAAETALRNGDAEQAAVAALYRRRRDLAVATLAGAAALRISAPDGAMYVMLDVRPTGLSGESFAMRLLDEERIAVMPGESFGQAAAGHVRVALTIEDDKMAAALGRLAEFAERIRDG